MKNQHHPPITFSQLKTHRWFWLLFGSLTSFIIGFLIIQASLNIWFPQWKTLPPLPNGETARRFNEVRFRDSIDVVTDLGNFYRCRFLVTNNCWIAIPVEDMQDVPPYKIRELQMPQPPRDARDVSLAYHVHDFVYEVFMVVIRRDGQVDIFDKDIFYWVINTNADVQAICASFYIIPGLVVGLIADLLVNRRWKRVRIKRQMLKGSDQD